jgi:hypothetical protein
MFFTLNDKKPQKIGNNSFNTNLISNKIKIHGNDNKIYNIQNNILKLSRKGIKNFRNSKFYINKNQKEDKSNSSDYGINSKQVQSSLKNEMGYNEMDNNINQKTIVRRNKLLGTNIINDDNSKQILHDIQFGNNFDLIDNEYSKRNKNRITIVNNTRNIKLRYNNTIFKPKKYNNEKEINNNLIINKGEENYNIASKGKINLISSISISKSSINNINYNTNSIIKRDDNINESKTFSILAYTKSLIFKKSKQKYQYLTLFRKHLLSEEHLLKSHITIVLLEKKYNINNDESTNFFECYDKL